MEKTNVIFYNSTLLKGGTERYISDVIFGLNKNKFNIDLIIKDGDNVDADILKSLENAGVNVFLAKGSLLERLKYLKNVLSSKEKHYDVIHINATSQGAGLISFLAKHYGKIKNVIFHSHMAGIDRKKDIVDKIGTKLMFRYSNKFAACSDIASNFMFGKTFSKKHHVHILNNSINEQNFDFNSSIREKMRKNLNLSKKDFAIIHVGRFAPQKNHKKLIEIFDEYHKQNSDAKLFLIGDGPLKDEISNMVDERNLTNFVTFLGLKNNVQDYLQASDLFLFPSVHEGLGIVLIEAQCSGLPVVASTNVPPLAVMCEEIFKYVNLDDDMTKWIDAINSLKNTVRSSKKECLISKGFDQTSAIKIIEKLYTE